jgi:NADH:ubiquinone oxidoreductase subunit 3 (subunit A)
MLHIEGHTAFWIFTFTELIFLTVVIIIARALGPSKPNIIKSTIFECGNPLFGNAKDFQLTGVSRYFGYAVVFFALDAFSWIVLSAAMSIEFTSQAIASVSVYILIILVGIGYFLHELYKVVV